MNRIVTLNNGKILHFKSLEAQDVAVFYAYQDKLGAQTNFTMQYPGRPKKPVEKTIKQFDDPNQMNIGLWDNGVLVGVIGAALLRPDHPWVAHVCEFWIGLLQGYHNQGLGTQMMQVLEEWAKSKNVKRIEGRVRTGNRQGIALYLKCGFKIEGHHLHTALIDGQWHDEYTIAKLLD